MARYQLVRISWLALALVACTPSLATLEAENQREVARAESTAGSAGTPFAAAKVDVPASTSPVATAGSHGLLESEHVVALAGGELVLVGGVCTAQMRCGAGCARLAEYRTYRAADGHVVVVRMLPVEDIVDTQDDPSCAAGCGGGNPGSRMAAAAGPQPEAGLDLGITSLAQLEIREERYTVKEIRRVCTNTEPVP